MDRESSVVVEQPQEPQQIAQKVIQERLERLLADPTIAAVMRRLARK